MADIRSDNSEVFHYDNPDFRVSIRKNFIPKDYMFEDMSIHWHDEVEFLYVESGSIRYQLNGRIVRMRAGEGIFVNSRQLHLIVTDHVDCELYCLIFHPMILEAMSNKIGRYISDIITNTPYIMLKTGVDWQKEILLGLKDIYDCRHKTGAELITMMHLYHIWAKLVQNVPSDSSGQERTGKNLAILKKIITYIQQNYREKINLEVLCAVGNVGKTKCSTLFAEYINMTPIEYVQYYRIEKSMELLERTDLNITEIAYESGFSESSYFTETFRRMKGVSPTKYRAYVKGQEESHEKNQKERHGKKHEGEDKKR
ncbi:MAG: helix-turn-helix domain-containing protein [Lachnospiraceae bacterium]